MHGVQHFLKTLWNMTDVRNINDQLHKRIESYRLNDGKHYQDSRIFWYISEAAA